MTFPKKTALLFAALALVIPLSSCEKPNDTLTVTGDYLAGKEAKDTYNAYLASSIATLNSAKSQSATDVRHIANFVDGLLMNNEFGILERQLASAASHDNDFKNFYFTIKDDVHWYTYDAQEYTTTDAQGNTVVQFVKADDFVNSAEIILNYANGSEIAYMVTMFIDGGWEYYCYTEMLDLIKNKDTSYAGINWSALKAASNDEKATRLMDLIAFESGADLADVAFIDGSDLANIANFSRVGVIADSEFGIHYRLNQPARFFPTLLTYAPFYPINRAFFKQYKMAGFGTSKDKMLYNGPFLCSEWGDNKVQYTRNEGYYNVSDVHIKTVNYTVAPDTISYAEIREAFEVETVDGFTLAPTDTIGWAQYITGGTPEDPGTGTIQNPYNSLVNSRELKTIDYTWHFTLNVQREENITLQPNTEMADAAYGAAAIINTNRALKIKEVRRLVLDAINFEIYNDQYEAATEPNQYQLNTLTPPGYVYDENDKDYIDYYYEKYAEEKGLADAAAAKALVGPQTIAGVNYSDSYVNTELYQPALEAVTQYNLLNPASPITLPIAIENAGLAGYATDQAIFENAWINNFNLRANGGVTGTPFVKMINNMKTTSSSAASTNSYAGYYTLSSWGWIGDYADPLTYVNTYTTNGDMSLFTGTKASRDNYYLDGTDTLVYDEDGLLEEFDELVDTAKSIYNSDALRYEAFADAEYELLNDVYIIKPHSMTTQGWTASVSRAMGYENPTASYGLADYRLTGMWVLVTPPTGEERQIARDLQAEKKVAALALTGSYNYVGSDPVEE